MSFLFLKLDYSNRKREKELKTPRLPFWTKEHLRAMFSWKIIKKVAFTLGVLTIYKFGSLVSLPDVNTSVLVSENNPLAELMSLAGGGFLDQFSIFSLGITPFISAQIVVQMLSMDVVPYFSEQRKLGKSGRNVLAGWTMLFAVILSLIQGYGISQSFASAYPGLYEGNFNLSAGLYSAVLMTAGMVIAVWLGNQITKHGIGNGITLLISVSILSRFPSLFETSLNSVKESQEMVVYFILFFLCAAVFSVIFSLAEYRIPILYSSGTPGFERSYLPLKVNSAGVMPVIFASSLIMIPLQIVNLFFAENTGLKESIEMWCGLQSIPSVILYIVLLILLSFAFAFIQINPEELAKNLDTSGAWIPDIRPGKETEKKLKKVLFYLTIFGSVSLTLTAILPYLLSLFETSIPSQNPIGGTGMIILVGATVETFRQYRNLIIEEGLNV